MRSKKTSHPFSSWLSPKLLNLASSVLQCQVVSGAHDTMLGLFGPLYEAYIPVLASSSNPCDKWELRNSHTILYFAVSPAWLLIHCPGSNLYALPLSLSTVAFTEIGLGIPVVTVRPFSETSFTHPCWFSQSLYALFRSRLKSSLFLLPCAIFFNLKSLLSIKITPPRPADVQLGLLTRDLI